ncbi:hypothetical protein GPECTOR_11g235 [Gonium pectorale]|uniref:Uncharacterized protein n=1 Tax=Gonium pectorale TaxID=33097 RepID=A0A150GPX6_GONPE|nr:hypothetical protein GPECTOR_11g235 [Gonium pectorale]|eukprot:KXZ51792.1 hypothetical protein GPECTOR_11g235 [Gonium pectorale]
MSSCVAPQAEEEAEDGAWDLASGRLDGPADAVTAELAKAEAAAITTAVTDGEDGPYIAAGGGAARGDRAGSDPSLADTERRSLPTTYRTEPDGTVVDDGADGGDAAELREGYVMAAAPGRMSSRVSGSGGAGVSPVEARNGFVAAAAPGRMSSRMSAASGGTAGGGMTAPPYGGSVPGSGGSMGRLRAGESTRLEPTLESFSVPAEPYGNDGGSGGRARAVAEAVEALAAEEARWPSFCRRPSVVEVRRWAKRGAAWFDDALPAAPSSDLGPDYAPPSLPLPPPEEDEAEEEARVAEEEAPETLPALDPDAILRRMLLSRLKDRRGRGKAAGASMPAAAAVVGGSGRVGSFLERSLSRRASASGANGSGGGGAVGGGRAMSESGVTAAAVAAPAADEWMDEVVRSAESALAAVTRGASVTDGAAAGGGSRAVRAVMRGRRRSQSPPSPSAAASPDGTGSARRRRPGPVAEGREDGGSSSSSSSSSSDDSDNEGFGPGDGGPPPATGEGKMESTLSDLKDAGIGLASMLVDKNIAINDPYYRKGTRYKGVPRYMDEDKVSIQPADGPTLLALADGLAGRLRGYPAPADEPLIRGADLRERNIKWYNLGLSPSEYPMKPGQWKAALRKAKAAAAAARLRAAVGPGGKVVVRSRKAWFGLPAMPSRPELKQTSALVYAVRLARPSCVAALLAASLQHLNLADGWGHTPVAYAAYMLARSTDRTDARLQQVYDMLLERLPQVNFTRLDSENGDAGHSLLCPLNLAVVTGDRARLAHLVLRCSGAVNCSWTALLDIPTYLNGTWEKVIARCDSRCPAIALAVLSKKLDMVKLLLDLGANPNVFGESRDVRLKAKLLREYEEEQERSRRLADEYEGILNKAQLGLMQKLARLKRAIAAIEIPGLTRPHPFVTPLHLAARTGQAEAAFLLLRRGALANGAGSVPYAKKSPLQEALMYARSNYVTTNPAAKRKNWMEVRPELEDLPPMSDAAAKKEADQRANAIMRAFVDPTMMALKAVALAGKCWRGEVSAAAGPGGGRGRGAGDGE